MDISPPGSNRSVTSPSSSSVTSHGSDIGSLDISSLQRLQRNLAEKQRRDKFNGYIHELASIVPMIAKTAKRLDKTSILRLTAAHMRLHLSSLNLKNGRKTYPLPAILNSNLHVVQEAIGGFLLVVSCTGKIIFTSSNVESYIGHQDIDMMGHSLYTYIHIDDLTLAHKEMDNLVINSDKKSKRESRTSFCAHVKEYSQPRSETVSYRSMVFHCSLSIEENKRKHDFHRISYNKSETQDNNVEYTSLIRMFVQPVSVNPLNELTITEAFRDEYVTTHGLKAEILYADHRISTITGHLPNEVRGMSAYQYIFKNDVPVALFAQKLMFTSNSGTGIIVYRLRTRSNNFVYLQSTGFLEYNDSSTEISHFICYNKLLSEEEGKDELKKFQERFLPHRMCETSDDEELNSDCKIISNKEPSSSLSRNQSSLNSELNGMISTTLNQDIFKSRMNGTITTKESSYLYSEDTGSSLLSNHVFRSDSSKNITLQSHNYRDSPRMVLNGQFQEPSQEHVPDFEVTDYARNQINRLVQHASEGDAYFGNDGMKRNDIAGSNGLVKENKPCPEASFKERKRRHDIASNTSLTRYSPTVQDSRRNKKLCQLNNHRNAIKDTLNSPEIKSNGMRNPTPVNPHDLISNDPTIDMNSLPSLQGDIDTALDDTEPLHFGQGIQQLDVVNHSTQNGAIGQNKGRTLPNGCDFSSIVEGFSYFVEDNYFSNSKNLFSPHFT